MRAVSIATQPPRHLSCHYQYGMSTATLALSDFSRVIESSAIIMLGLASPLMLLIAFIIMTILIITILNNDTFHFLHN